MKNLRKFIYIVLFIICSFGISAAQQTKTQKSTNVKIIKRFPARYTKETRERRITGNITLKVEFLPDGKIGKVEEVAEANEEKMRKYGLVDSAIKAARLTEFEPATVNGKPVKQIRSISYSFKIM